MFEMIYLIVYLVFKASVAQLVELLICNQWVGGSSPFAGSRMKEIYLEDDGRFFWWGSRVVKGNRL